jgi:hypothetical protein
MLTRSARPFTTFLALLIPCEPSLAADRLVPAQYPTVQAAIDAAAPNDTVLVSPGTYAGPIDLLGKAIAVRGTGEATATIISGGASVVRCISGESASTIIENLTVTGGTGTEGSGIRVVGSSPTIRGCRIIANRATGAATCRGGGVFVDGGNPAFADCVIGANFVGSSGGSGCSNGIVDSMSTGHGGGICVIAGSPTFDRCTISGNQVRGATNGCNAVTAGYGGGIYKHGSGTLVLRDCSVTSNSVEISASAYCNPAFCCGDGGGAWISGLARLERCVIRENTKAGCAESTGGLRFDGVGAELVSTRVCGNAPNNIAGAYINSGGNSILTTCPSCSGDLSGDGQVNGADLAMLLANWGTCPN